MCAVPFCGVLSRAELNMLELCAHTHTREPLFSINAAAAANCFRMLDEIDFYNLLLLFSRHLVFVFVEAKIAGVYTVYQKWFDWHTHAANTKAKLCVFAFSFVIHNRHLFHWVTNANEWRDAVIQLYSTYTLNTLHMPYTHTHTHTHIVMWKEMVKWVTQWNQTNFHQWHGIHKAYDSYSLGATKHSSHTNSNANTAHSHINTEMRPPILFSAKWCSWLSGLFVFRVHRYTEYANTIAQVNYWLESYHFIMALHRVRVCMSVRASALFLFSVWLSAMCDFNL